jgi:hypothetical protein
MVWGIGRRKRKRESKRKKKSERFHQLKTKFKKRRIK